MLWVPLRQRSLHFCHHCHLARRSSHVLHFFSSEAEREPKGTAPKASKCSEAGKLTKLKTLTYADITCDYFQAGPELVPSGRSQMPTKGFRPLDLPSASSFLALLCCFKSTSLNYDSRCSWRVCSGFKLSVVLPELLLFDLA